ncbi:hypothetical protein HID58_041084 [Brassica napus]|uniref:DOG1 domain-containing protein n=1 Tax=Brassica napus TaxID=3708 RepID=A0ABQ8BBG3_BRANA|nr:hypothetical protein HID58_041084 [Brassica napus]
MENPSSSNIEEVQQECYDEWMSLQAKRMTDLKRALANGEKNDGALRELIQSVIEDFKDYARKRSEHSRRYSSNYFAPTWNTCLENALLWMGGCRPSSFIRLVYAMCGSQPSSVLPTSSVTTTSAEPLPSTGTIGGDGTPPTVKTNHGRTNLHKDSNRRAKTDGSVPARTILCKTSSPGDRGRRSRRYESRRFPEAKPYAKVVLINWSSVGLSMALGETPGRTDGAGESMSDLTAEQLFKINELHMKTVQEENMLTKQSATLQEDTADMPIAVAAFHKERIGEADVEVELALDKYEDEMARMLAEADKLRLTTLTKIVEILTAESNPSTVVVVMEESNLSTVVVMEESTPSTAVVVGESNPSTVVMVGEKDPSTAVVMEESDLRTAVVMEEKTQSAARVMAGSDLSMVVVMEENKPEWEEEMELHQED